ncbi:MAG: hypothetical protein OXE79_06635 [Acidimicrobiaceae bacterium]|nr:hypothetical protein [Acidimicrobiaceae bacterium]MCY4281131.1 hypothetical protein [Acidimicrobiaceae bacterium]MCY4294403.1 hypothetical protein [Acidimicrobiaceae bacterium]
MIWLFAASGAAAALRLVLGVRPVRVTGSTAELSAAGWPPQRLRAASMMSSTFAVILVLASVTLLAGYRSGVLAALTVGFWAPAVMPLLLSTLVISGYRVRRDAALLEWLRRIRLYTAAGRPINDAAVEAAELVEAPAFAPAASSINLALASGSDPLSAVSQHFAGSEAETLIGTLAAAERGGAAAAGLVDRLVSGAVKALEDARRVRIEALGRAVAGTCTVASIVAGAVVVLALLAGIDLGV